MAESPDIHFSPVVYPTVPRSVDEATSFRGAGKRTAALKNVAKCLLQGRRCLLVSNRLRTDIHTLKLLVTQEAAGGDAGAEGGRKEAGKVRTVFGDYSFADTVGLWLEYARTDGAMLLDPFISTEGFTFTPAEFVDLRERLDTARRRYERLPNPSRGLEDLNTGFFRHQSLADSTDFITSRVGEFLATGDRLHRDYLLAVNGYARAAGFAFREQNEERQNTVAELEQQAQLLHDRSLSGRERKRQLRVVFDAWSAYHQHHYATAPTTAAEADALVVALAAERRQLLEAQQSASRELRSSGLGLSPVTANPALIDGEQLAELDSRLRDLIRAVDEAGLYQLPVGGAEAATTPRQLQQLEALLGKLRNTERHLGELPLFYERRHFWYAQPAHLRRLLAPLTDLPTADWEAAFATWYFDRCLEAAGGEKPEPAVPLATPEPAAAVDWEKLVGLSPGEEIPAGPYTLAADLTGTGNAALPAADQTLRTVPLHHPEAVHFALAGRRRAALAFVQPFQPLTPPAWTVRPAAERPSGPQTGVVVQPGGAGEWIALADWAPAGEDLLNVFLPRILPPAAGAVLLARWEELIETDELHFFHDHTPNDLTQALLTDGFTADFLSAALLRAAEAAELEPFDRAAFLAMGREVRLRCGLPAPEPSPLGTNYARILATSVPAHLLDTHVPWRNLFLPLVQLDANGRKTAYLPDGRVTRYGDAAAEEYLRRELTVAGFHLKDLDSYAVWRYRGNIPTGNT